MLGALGFGGHGRQLLAATVCSGSLATAESPKYELVSKSSAPVNNFVLVASDNQLEPAAVSRNAHRLCSDTAAAFCQNPRLSVIAAQLRAVRSPASHYLTSEPFGKLGCLNINFVLKEEPNI